MRRFQVEDRIPENHAHRERYSIKLNYIVYPEVLYELLVHDSSSLLLDLLIPQPLPNSHLEEGVN